MGRHYERFHQDVPPWRRRQVARNTGVKCERSDTPKAYKALLTAQRERAERAWERVERGQA